MSAFDRLPGASGDAYERMCGTTGDTWERLAGTTGDAWERLIVSCGVVISSLVKQGFSYIKEGIQGGSKIDIEY